jgi:hypothetical protein
MRGGGGYGVGGGRLGRWLDGRVKLRDGLTWGLGMFLLPDKRCQWRVYYNGQLNGNSALNLLGQGPDNIS